MCGGGGSKKQKASKGEKMQAKVAKEQWADYKKRFIPVENKYIDKVKSLKKEAPLAATRAAADTAQAFRDVQAQKRNQLGAAGVNPSSGRSMSETQALGLDKASATSKNITQAKQSSERRYMDGLMGAIKLGRDIANDANLGFRSAAETGAYTARQDAADSAARAKLNRDMWGTVAGAATSYGLGAYNKWSAKQPNTLGQTAGTFASQAGQGTWGDPFASPRKL